MSEPHEMVADFYKGLIGQQIPRDVAVLLTAEWIKAMFNLAKDQARQSNAIVEWLKTQRLEKKD